MLVVAKRCPLLPSVSQFPSLCTEINKILLNSSTVNTELHFGLYSYFCNMITLSTMLIWAVSLIAFAKNHLNTGLTTGNDDILIKMQDT